MDSNAPAREMIKQKMLSVLGTKSINDLTVLDIARTCGISTRTFYNNFLDKHDLVHQIYHDLNRDFWQANPANKNLKDYSDAYYRFFLQHKRFFANTLCYTGQNCLREAIKEQGLEDLSALIRTNFPQEELSPRTRVALLFFVEGSLGLMMSLLQGKVNPADFPENHNALYDNMPEILKKYFE